jgi:AcrR family transcriptional regulator
MARPPEFDRAVALTEALHLFWERGYDGTSIRDLTRAMGISAPSLYNAFGGKKELYDEAVAEYENSPAVVVAQAVGEPTAREFVEKVLEAAVREYGSDDHPRGCFVISDPLLDENRRVARDVIRDRLRVAHDAGDLPDDSDVEALTDFLDVFLRGLSSRARDGAAPATLRAAADLALRAWLSGL